MGNTVIEYEEFEFNNDSSHLMSQLHVRYARNLWIYEDMFGCITASGGDPEYKVMNLIPDSN